METIIIGILALVSLALTGALLVAGRRPNQRPGGIKDILETLVDPRVAEMRAEMNKVSDLAAIWIKTGRTNSAN